MRILLWFIISLSLSACGGRSGESAVGSPAEPGVARAPGEGTASNIPAESVDVNPLNDPTPLDELIRITSPVPGETVTSPIKLRGKPLVVGFSRGNSPWNYWTTSETFSTKPSLARKENG